MLIRKNMKQHASQASKTCSNYHTSFRKIEHFQNHEIVCKGNNEGKVIDEQFTPSFAFPDNSVSELNFLKLHQLAVCQHHPPLL